MQVVLKADTGGAAVVVRKRASLWVGVLKLAPERSQFQEALLISESGFEEIDAALFALYSTLIASGVFASAEPMTLDRTMLARLRETPLEPKIVALLEGVEMLLGGIDQLLAASKAALLVAPGARSAA